VGWPGVAWAAGDLAALTEWQVVLLSAHSSIKQEYDAGLSSFTAFIFIAPFYSHFTILFLGLFSLFFLSNIWGVSYTLMSWQKRL